MKIFFIPLFVVLLLASLSYTQDVESENVVLEAEKFKSVSAKVLTEQGVKCVFFENKNDTISTGISEIFSQQKYSILFRIKFPDQYRHIYRDYRILAFTLNDKTDPVNAKCMGGWRWIKVKEVDVAKLEEGVILIEMKDFPVMLDKIALVSDYEEFINEENEKEISNQFGKMKKPVAVAGAKEYSEFVLTDFEIKSNGKEVSIVGGKKATAFSDTSHEYVTGFTTKENKKCSLLLKVKNNSLRGYFYPLAVFIDNQLLGVSGTTERPDWYWIYVNEANIDAGNHILKIESGYSNLIVEKAVFFYGPKENLFLHEWYNSVYAVKADITPISVTENVTEINATDFQVVNPAGRIDLGGQDKFLEFNIDHEKGLTKSANTVMVNIENPANYNIQACFYFNREDANYGWANSIIFGIDGHTTQILSDRTYDEWHWLSAGMHRLEKGTHYIMFYTRHSPVLLSKIIISKEGVNEKEIISKKNLQYQFSRNMPFGIKNSIPYKKAEFLSNWTALGDMGKTAKMSVENLGRQGNFMKIEFQEGNQNGHLALKDRAPVMTLPITERENYFKFIDMEVAGDVNDYEIYGLYVDRNREVFKARFLTCKENTKDGVSTFTMNLGKYSKSGELESSGVNKDGIVDFPVRLTHIVFKKLSSSKGSLLFKKPCLAKTCEVKAEITNTALKPGEKIKTKLLVLNNSELKRSFDVVLFATEHSDMDTPPEFSEKGERTAIEINANSSSEIEVSVSGQSEGIYDMFFCAGVTKPKKATFCVGEKYYEEYKKLIAEIEKRNGAFRFSKDGDKPLLRKDGTPIKRTDVKSVYGSPEGFAIFCDGKDVCSREYAEANSFNDAIVPTGMDLSNLAGWPYIDIPPGILAIDPELGRLKFSPGYSGNMELLGNIHTGFGVPSAPVVISGNYLYEPPGEGDMTVIDISDKSNPKVCNYYPSWFFYGGAHKYKNYLYFNASRGGGLWAIDDVSFPEMPAKLENVSCDIYPRISWINEKEDIAYGYDGKNLVMYDMKAYNRFSFYDSVSGIENLVLGDDQKYFLCTRDNGEKIFVYDLSSPRKPKLVSTFGNFREDNFKSEEELLEEELDGALEDVENTKAKKEAYKNFPSLRCVKNGVLYIMFEGGKQMGLVNIKDKNKPKPVALFDLEKPVATFAFKDNFMFLIPVANEGSQNSIDARGDRSEILVYDVSDLKKIKIVSTFREELPTAYRSIVIDGDYGYVTDYNYGVWIFDIKNPKNIKKLGGAATAGEGHWGYVSDTIAMVANTFSGSIILCDASDPYNLKRLGEYWDGEWLNYCSEIQGKDNFVYAAKAKSIAIIDISNPDSPKRKGSFCAEKDIPVIYGDIEVEDNYGEATAYVCGVNEKSNKGCLFIYDLKNPGIPELVSKLEVSGQEEFVIEKYRDRVYLMNQNKLLIVSVADAKEPKLLGGLKAQNVKDLPKYSDDIKTPPSFFAGQIAFSNYAVAGNYLYAFSGGGEDMRHFMNVFDVSDPKNIKYVKTNSIDRYGWQFNWDDVKEYEGNLIVSDYALIDFFDLSDPENPKLVESIGTDNYEWKVGEVKNGIIYCPTLGGLRLIKVRTKSQVPSGQIEIRIH